MLPIPVATLNVSNKRLVIPLLYLVLTASLCYTFLVALLGTRTNTTSALGKNSKSAKISVNSPDIDKQTLISDNNYFEQVKESQEEDNSTEIIQDERRINTRRSNSTEIWIGHQDLKKVRLNGNRPKKKIKEKDKYLLKNDQEPVVYYPWQYDDDEQCKKFYITFAKKKTFKPRAIVSFPGSGNSWLRYLIEACTGYFTGSIYNDKSLYNSGLLGEYANPNDGSTIVQKTHHNSTIGTNAKGRLALLKLTQLMFGYRGILLIRNPYDALLSYWNYFITRDHKGRAENFDELEWRKFTTIGILRWSSLIADWITNSQDLLIVQYESLKLNPKRELHRILEYLQQPVNSTRIECLLKPWHFEGPFKRPHNENSNFSSSLFSSPFFKDFTNMFAKELELVRNSPPLDLIIQEHIAKINLLLQTYYPTTHFLKYTEPTITTTDKKFNNSFVTSSTSNRSKTSTSDFQQEPIAQPPYLESSNKDNHYDQNTEQENETDFDTNSEDNKNILYREVLPLLNKF